MTAPTLSAPAVSAARSRAVAHTVSTATDQLALPVLVVGLVLCLVGYAAFGWWMLQAVVGLVAWS